MKITELTEDKTKAAAITLENGWIALPPVQCNVDKTPHKTKPTGATISAIINKKKPAKVTFEELGDIISRGGSFNAGLLLQGKSQRDWDSQELLGLDMDNADAKEPLTVEDALVILSANYLRPVFVYHTFSSTPEKPKYRIVFHLTEPCRNLAKIYRLTYRINKLLTDARPGCLDKCNLDFNRVFFGTNKPILWSTIYDPIDINEMLDIMLPKADDEDRELFNKLQSIKKPTSENDIVPAEFIKKIDDLIKAENLKNFDTPADVPEEPKPKNIIAGLSDLDAMEEKVKADIANFDLLAYIRPRRHGKRYTCPICHSSEGLEITGAFWCCHGTNHLYAHKIKPGNQKPGGDIIDYIADKEKIDLGAAKDKFKFEIMGYNREDFKKAYAEKMQAEETAQINAGLATMKANHKTETKTDAVEAVTDPAEPSNPSNADAPADLFISNRPNRTGTSLIDNFLQEVQAETYQPISTGINDLDRRLDGGLINKTLVLIGAAPGMGKTALCQYIAESMAENGRTVLYINLEMSQAQLVARTLSKIAWKFYDFSITPVQMLRAYEWNDAQKATANKAMAYYKDHLADNIIYSPEGQPHELGAVLELMQKESALAKEKGQPCPVIFVDYLQLIENSATRDEVTGMKGTIKALKDYAMENNTIVIAIMATNRTSNQSGQVNQESGRDTSAIEYSGDLLLGLTYTAIGEEYQAGTKKDGTPIFKKWDKESILAAQNNFYEGKPWQECPRKIWEEITIKVNKNRFGTSGGKANLIFEGKHNNFKQIEKQPETFWQDYAESHKNKLPFDNEDGDNRA